MNCARFKISDSFFERKILLDKKCVFVKDLKHFISIYLNVPEDEFIFTDTLKPDQKISSFPIDFIFEIKFINPSDDLFFQLLNSKPIAIKAASGQNYEGIIKILEKQYGIYFSKFCNEKLTFNVFKEPVPRNGFNLRGLPKSAIVVIKLKYILVNIRFDNKSFVFAQNEFVGEVMDLLYKVYPPSIEFLIKSTKLNSILKYKNNQLKSDDNYEIIGSFLCQFIGPQNFPCKIKLDFFSTFRDAKALIEEDHSNVVIFIGDTKLDDLSKRVIDFVGKTNFYFEIIGKEKISPTSLNKAQPPPSASSSTHPPPTGENKAKHIIPRGNTTVFNKSKNAEVAYPKIPDLPPVKDPNPPKSPSPDPKSSPSSDKTPPPSSSSAHPPAKSPKPAAPTAKSESKPPPPSSSPSSSHPPPPATKPESKPPPPKKPDTPVQSDEAAAPASKEKVAAASKKSKKPKVSIKTTAVEDEIVVYFEIEESVCKKIKPIKKNVKTTDKIKDLIESIKNENDLEGELEARYKRKDDKIKLDLNQTIGDVHQHIHQLNEKKNVIYVVSAQNKSKPKPKPKPSKDDEDSKPKPKPKEKPKPESKHSGDDYELSTDSISINILSPELIEKLQPQLTNDRLIGKGATSTVYKVNCIDDNNQYDESVKKFRALKILNKEIFIKPRKSQNEKDETKWSDDDDDDDEIEANSKKEEEEEDKIEIDINKIRSFFQEYDILSHLNHPNIVKSFGFFNGDEKYAPCILLEYHGHNLNSIKKIGNDKNCLISIICELCSVMKLIHEKKIIHRDLKPSNILLDKSKHVKLCDFGIAKIISTETQTQSQSNTLGVGTIGYMAPEIIQPGGDYNEKVDVFSFGIVVHFILSGCEIPAYKFDDAINNKEIPMSKKINKISRNLINRCISYYPDNRPSFIEIEDFLRKNGNKMID